MTRHVETTNQTAISVGRALQVLDGFIHLERPATLAEVTRIVGLSKSTTFRLLKQLVESNYLERRGNEYSLSLHAFRLGNRYSRQGSHGLREVAGPFLGSLFQHTSLLVNLAVLDGNAVVYLDRIQGMQALNAPGGVGTRLPATTTALGKAILAFSTEAQVRAVVNAGLPRMTPRSVMAPGLLLQQLNRAATEGVAIDHEEAAAGLHCVAAPILIAGSPVGSISVSGGVGRFQQTTLGPLVKRTADRIAHEFMTRVA